MKIMRHPNGFTLSTKHVSIVFALHNWTPKVYRDAEGIAVLCGPLAVVVNR